MGIFQGDLILFSAFNYALQDIRKNLHLVEDILGVATEDELVRDTYGKKEVDKFKKFVKTTKIFVNIEHRIEQGKYPSIAIGLGPGQEDKAKAAIGDSQVNDSVTPDTIGGLNNTKKKVLGPVTPLSYDKDVGTITFCDDTDLTGVFSGQFVVDKKGRKFEIQLVLSSSQILIDSGQDIDLTNMEIVRSREDFISRTKKSFWAYEDYNIRLASTDATELIYLWSLVMYILGRYKKSLFEARNFEITTFSYSQVYKVTGDDVNVLFGRDIALRGRVEHSWVQSHSPAIEGIGPDIRISDMKSPEAVLDQVEKQGWQGEFDNNPSSGEDE